VKAYADAQQRIRSRSRTWLVTGTAGFIGGHLAENLLKLDQNVVGLDNFSTGKRENLTHIRAAVGEARWKRFRFIEGDIRSLATCRDACAGAEVVLHQAALGSVPRSIDDPIASTDNNVMGFLNMLVAARDEGIRRFVYASSSAVYGDHPALPKVEDTIGRAVSPYGLSKHVNELLDEAVTRWDVNWVIGEFLGELNASHTYHGGGDEEHGLDRRDADRPAGVHQRRRHRRARLRLHRQRGAGEPARRDRRGQGGAEPRLQHRPRRRDHAARAVRQDPRRGGEPPAARAQREAGVPRAAQGRPQVLARRHRQGEAPAWL